MKRIATLFVAAIVLTLASCNVGVHSVSSGKADEAALLFMAPERYDIAVIVDGTTYALETVKKKAYRAARDIKRSATQQVVVSPGRHSVQVTRDGKEVYTKEIFVSAAEQKVIEL